MNDAQLARLLTERNSWWANPEWERDDPDLRPLRATPFTYRPEPLRGITPGGLYLLLGPRRVGKTVELKRAVAAVIEAGAAPRQVTFLSCDGLRAADLRRAVGVARNLTRVVAGPRYWFIDEVTSVPGWPAVIKDLRDGTDFRDACVVLTGSSSRDLQDAVDHLAGRRGDDAIGVERLLLPMPFRSFCHMTGHPENLPDVEPFRPRDVFDSGRDALEQLAPRWPELADQWELYLAVGGYPQAVRTFVERGAVAPAFRRDLWDVIRGEAFRSSRMTDAETLGLVARLAEGLGGPLNLSRITRDVGLSSHHLVEDRITSLTAAFLAFRCYREEAGRPNLGAQRKLYFVDPLVATLAQERDRSYPVPDVPYLSEQQLALALARAVERERPGSFVAQTEVRFWRNPISGTEVDFVGPALAAGFESKYVDAGWRRETQALIHRQRGGIVATRGALALDDDAFAVPAGLLVWLLGG